MGVCVSLPGLCIDGTTTNEGTCQIHQEITTASTKCWLRLNQVNAHLQLHE